MDPLAIAAIAISLAAVSISIWQARLARAGYRLQRADFNDARRAWISVDLEPPALHGARSVAYSFLLTNIGRAHARHLLGWIEDRHGSRVSGPLPVAGTLPPDGTSRLVLTVDLTIAAHLNDAWFQLRWDDWQRDSPGAKLEPSSRVTRFDPASEWASTHLPTP